MVLQDRVPQGEIQRKATRAEKVHVTYAGTTEAPEGGIKGYTIVGSGRIERLQGCIKELQALRSANRANSVEGLRGVVRGYQVSAYAKFGVQAHSECTHKSHDRS